MRHNLPENISVSSPELAIAVTMYFQAQGYTILPNIKFDNCLSWEQPYINLSIHLLDKEIGWWGSKEASNHFTSWKDFYDWIEAKIVIAGYNAVLSPKGIKVGCTFVSWEEVDIVNKMRKDLGY